MQKYKHKLMSALLILFCYLNTPFHIFICFHQQPGTTLTSSPWHQGSSTPQGTRWNSRWGRGQRCKCTPPPPPRPPPLPHPWAPPSYEKSLRVCPGPWMVGNMMIFPSCAMLCNRAYFIMRHGIEDLWLQLGIQWAVVIKWTKVW